MRSGATVHSDYATSDGNYRKLWKAPEPRLKEQTRSVSWPETLTLAVTLAPKGTVVPELSAITVTARLYIRLRCTQNVMSALYPLICVVAA